MNEQLFRKKNIERISSPEQLNDYIRVSNPGMWLLFTAVVILLVGVCVWGIFGRLDTKLFVCAVGANGSVVCYVAEDQVSSVSEGMTLIIGETEYHITAVAGAPLAVDNSFGEYALHVGGLQIGQWVYTLQTDAALPDGVYQAQIVIDSVAPIFFILN